MARFGSIAIVKIALLSVAPLLLSASIARATPASDAAFEEGKALVTAKDYAGAAAKFETVIAADANNDLAWYQLASASRQAGHCDRAIVAYKRYMDLVPNMSLPYYGLGLCLAQTGDKAGAVAALKHFVAVAPPNSKRYADHAAAVIAELTGPAPGAATPGAGGAADAAAAKPVPVSPGNAAYVEAQTLRDRGHVEEAIAKFKQAFATDPRHWAARTALGELLLKIRRDDEAITVLKGTVDKNPSYSLAWYDLAFALRVRTQYAAAVDAYDHYIKLKPADPDPYYGLGRSLQHLGRAADARRAFETYLSLEKRPSEQRWVESAEMQLRTLAESGQPGKSGK
ncbi:MAG TPA: tetratricopeptide repeat protein [Polyangia bacterium]|jgi:tetratricopeptide (TPR) repeat protein